MTYAFMWMTVFSGVLGTAFALGAQNRIRARALLARNEPVLAAWRYWVRPLAARLGVTGKERDELVSLLQQAGRSDATAMDRFLEEKAAALVLGGGAALLVLAVDQEMTGLLAALLCLAVGVFGAKKRVEREAVARKEQIGAALPSAVDLLMTSVDAGLSIEAAIARVGRELKPSWPMLSHELSLTAMECEASVPLAEALRRLARRVELEDLSALCGVIAQAHLLGAPIVRTLAEYTDNTRKLRMALLEEKAGKLATQLTFPLAAFLVPSSLVFMLGPALLQLVRLMAQG